jgi:hypothetical protein
MSSYPIVIWSDGHGFNVEWRGREDAQCHQDRFTSVVRGHNSGSGKRSTG